MIQKKIIVSLPDDTSERIDVYLISHIDASLSRSRLKAGIVFLKCNNKNAKLSARVKNGDVIDFSWKNPIPDTVEPESIPLNILYEDNNLIVLNKPQGMVVHPAHGNWSGTLVNALLFYLGKPAIEKSAEQFALSDSEKRPGIVHRLDKDTSGTIVTAKNDATTNYLKMQFKMHRVVKQYIAITKGHPPSEQGTIKTHIIRDPRNIQKFTVTDDKTQGKFAHTKYTCIALYGPYALMKVQIKTGRTHQIRVHMRHIGCPVLGDSLYGVKDTKFKTATLMLHAQKLGFRFPGKEEFHFFKSPTPIRFKKVLQVLHRDYERSSVWIKKSGK